MFKKTNDIKSFDHKMWLASPTMHGEELAFVQDAFDTNWVTTAGENVNELEKVAAEYVGCKHAVGLSCGTAALHLSMKLAGERLNSGAKAGEPVLTVEIITIAAWVLKKWPIGWKVIYGGRG